MKTFREYFDKYWSGLTFWEKVQYRLISLWGWIECYFQLITHKLFGIDWSDKSDEWEEWEDDFLGEDYWDDEWENAPLSSDYLGSESDPSI